MTRFLFALLLGVPLCAPLLGDCTDKQFKWNSLCVNYDETTYTDPRKEMPRKGIDFLSTGELSVAKYLNSRNDKADSNCKEILPKKREDYTKAKIAFDKEFQKKLPPKKPFDANTLDILEETMRTKRMALLEYEFQCGDCFVRVAKRWNGKKGQLPVYYESDGTCLVAKPKKNWVENGVKYFSLIKNYAKSTDYGLASIDAYRVFDVKKTTKKEDGKDVTTYDVTHREFNADEDPSKQLSFETNEKDFELKKTLPPKEAEEVKPGLHLAYIAVTAPFIFSLGYPYQGWVDRYKPTVKKADKEVVIDIPYTSVIFDTFFDNELRRSLDEFKPTPKRLKASGKSDTEVQLKKVESAVGSWSFGEDGSIRYFTAADFGKVFSSLGDGVEKVLLFPHAIKTLMETVFEAKERLEIEAI